MSIADKLTIIAENIQKVYDAGVKAGQSSAGGDGVFWDAFQQNGNRTVYAYAFYEWPDNAFYPKYDMIPETSDGPANMFYRSNIEDLASRLRKCSVSLDLSKCPRLGNTFYKCMSKSLPTIDMASCTSTSSTFQGMTNLTDLTIVNLRADCTFSSIFASTTNLVNLSISGIIGQNGFNVAACGKLTYDSLLNILNILDDKSSDTSGTTWTVTLGGTNLAKLSDADKTIATSKGWQLA